MKKTVSQYEKGQVMLTLVIFFLVLSMTIVLGIASPILRHVRISKDIILSKQAYYLANAGVEDAYYRVEVNKQLSSTEVVSANGAAATTTIVATASGKQFISTASAGGDVRKVQADVILGTGVSFHYGIQSGNGGFTLSNSSSVIGNVFSSGTVTGSGNMIYGDVISAGNTGLIYGVHATGSAYAHIIGNASQPTTIDKDAYYFLTKTNTTVGGTSYPGSTDQASSSLPISDTLISQWENDAVSGGTISSCDSSGNYTITSNVTLGPKKIACNLIVKSSSGVLTVTGALWVTGNITFQTGPTIKMSSALGSTNVAIIADNPSNTTGSGIISVGQSTIFQGSGSSGSFVFLISQNNSAEKGGATTALSMNQGASALVAYASHGLATLSQSVSVRAVTAYQIALTQSANVTYDTGLPNVLFAAGPAGGYQILDWGEVQ